MSDELVTTKDGVWRMDVDTFAPKPEGTLKIKGVEYPIFSFLDVEIGDALKVARLGDDIQNSDTIEARVQRSMQQIMLLNKLGEPKLTPEIFEGLSVRQIIQLTMMASTIAQIPLKTDRKESSDAANSPSPSPESVASITGG